MRAIDIIEMLEAIGCSERQILDAIKFEEAKRVRRRCERAMERALFPPAPHPALHADLSPAGRGENMNNAATDGRIEPIEPAAEPMIGRYATPEMNEAAMDGRIEAEATSDNTARTFARARESIERAADLSAVQCRVGLAILSHYNRSTGRCFPALRTIGETANVSERTARRAVKRLGGGADGLGLFEIVAHGGRSHTNAYRPRWDRLLALVQVANMNNAATPMRPSAQSGQIEPANAASGDPQTSESNLSLDRGVGTRAPHQISMMLPIPGGRDAATARWEGAVRGKYGGSHEELRMKLALAWLFDEHGALTDAELGSPGGGLKAFEAMLRERGPPGVSSTG